MTNEELCIAIQEGDTESINQLWKQCYGFIRQQANKWAKAWEKRPDIDADDFTQAGYIALCKAVRYFQEDKGGFLTILCYFLRAEFSEVAGCKTSRTLNEPLNNAVSLDAPINSDQDERTLGETVASDDTSIQDAEESVFQDQLSQTVTDALNTLPERQRKAIEGVYLTNKRYIDIAKELNCSKSYVMELIKTGFNKLRSGSSGPTLAELLYADCDLYRGVGFASWKATESSIQERIVIRNEMLVKKHRLQDTRVDKVEYCIKQLGMDRAEAERLFPV